MKKNALVILLILVLFAFSAAAEGKSYACAPGEEFSAVFEVAENPGHAVAATLRLNYDHDVFELIPSNFAQNDGAFMLDMNGIAPGASGTVPFRVKPDALDGTYTIELTVQEAGDINEAYVEGLFFPPVQVKVGAPKIKAKPENEFFPDGKLKKAYDYNDQGRLEWETVYNRYGKPTSIKQILGWDENGNPSWYTITYPGSSGKYGVRNYMCSCDEFGNEISYYYTYADGSFGTQAKKLLDERGNNIQVTFFKADGSVDYYQENYLYDENDHLLSFARYKADGALDYTYYAEWKNGVRVMSYEQDANHQETDRRTYDPVYGDTLSSWSKWEESYSETVYTYREDGYSSEDTSYSEDGQFNYRFVMEYAANGRLMKTIDYFDAPTVAYSTTTMDYKADGSLWETETYADGSYSLREENPAGQLEKLSRYDASHQLERYDLYQYDERGNKTEDRCFTASGELEYYYTYEYDGENREIRSISFNPDGSKRSEYKRRYTENGGTVTDAYYYYDDGGYSLYEEDDEGKDYRYTRYNASGQVERYTLYEYDAKGNKVSESEYDASNNLTDYNTFEYDAQGNRTRVTYYDGSRKMEYYVVYTYNEFGETLSSTAYYPNGNKRWETLYRYNSDGTSQSKTDYYKEDGTLRTAGEWN